MKMMITMFTVGLLGSGIGMAYSAARSERVEVACESRGGVGAIGYEKHESL